MAKRIDKPEPENYEHTETGDALDGKEWIRKWKEDGGLN